MKKSLLNLIVALAITSATCAQVQIDKPIQLTGGTGQRSMTNLETPVNGTDAVNKDYVDSKVAAGGSSAPTMITTESTSSFNYGDAIRYCRNRSESGFSDWRLPTFTEMVSLISKGGTTISGDNSANFLWLVDRATPTAGTSLQVIRLSDGSIGTSTAGGVLFVRCVR